MSESIGYGITFNPHHVDLEERRTSCVSSKSFRSGTGSINQWTLCQLLDDGKANSLFNNFCHRVELMNEGGKFVTFSAHFVFEWKQLSGINKLTYFPYKVITRLHDVQQPCVTNIQSLINMLDGKTIVKCVTDDVLVEIKSRRQKILPCWFIDEYKDFNGAVSDKIFAKKGLTGSGLLPQIPTSPPPFCVSVTVSEADTEPRGFLHKDSYVRYVVEGVDAACSRNVFPYLGSNMCDLHLRELSVCYLGNAVNGETLTLVCWQTDQPDRVTCIIKKGCSMIFSSQLIFDLGP